MSDKNIETSAEEDPFSALLHITPGYTIIDEGTSRSKVLVVNDMALGPMTVSVGFALDGTIHANNFGKPIFLHKRMNIRSLGSADDYLSDPFVAEQLPRVVERVGIENGMLPIIAVIESLRVDPSMPVDELVQAVFERQRALAT
jgi:hypothetical protein